MSNAEPADNVTPIRWSEQQYDEERAKFLSLYGDDNKEAGAKRDQAMATLFWRSGWTQDRLAHKEGKSQSYVARRLLFGRFLNSMPIGITNSPLPANLSEGAFRKLWDQTEKGRIERDRFTAVVTLMRGMAVAAPRRKDITKRIKAKFGDGVWRPLTGMAEEIEETPETVKDTVQNIKDQKLAGLKVERKTVGTAVHFRLFDAEKTVTVFEVREKLRPIIKDLDEQGQAHMAHWSPVTIRQCSAMLKKFLKEWAE